MNLLDFYHYFYGFNVSFNRFLIEAPFNPHRSSYLILRITSLLHQLSIAGLPVNLIWIPNHRSIPGNETTDALAKSAFSIGKDSQIGVPLRDFKNHLKVRMREKLFA